MPETEIPDPDARERLLDAILPHVPFDGWSSASFAAAVEDSGVDPTVARAVFPRRAVDAALAFHARGDAEMVARLDTMNLAQLKIREKITLAVRTRLEVIPDKELVRRGTTLFALPTHAADGAKAIWGTADLIWTTIGDISKDVNWYTKRATLAGVYSSTVLYWLGDESFENERTWDFLDRRIDEVMQFEKLKAQIRGNAMLKPLLAGPEWALGLIRAPSKTGHQGWPGKWSRRP